MNEDHIKVVVPVSAEDVDQALVGMILESGLGELIETEIKKAVSREHAPLIKAAIEQAVKVTVTNIAREKIHEHSDAIRNHMATLITEKFIIEVAGNFWDKVIDDFVS